ncbi:Antagonist of MEN (Mitotic Exit Network) [Entomortierella chlamydospora]|uniref:Antagonist of MEN (Mitotic Exit Network) n=1 Tax=Entomortierella chlamydospora TaxID=101097 RepID=A0A9P6T4H7_9FUNG|nr:Antagonist of MEN (Mitotic Exit Network) [Entomortierella chlamydospora]
MSGPSHSFFRRLLKVFVGGNNIEQQGYDLCNRKAHPLEGDFYDSSSTLEDQQGSEPQMDDSGSSEEYKCIRGSQHISNWRMMATSPPPGSQSNSVARYKKRSNSTATTSSIASAYSQERRAAKNSRPGRTASLSGDSTGSGSDYSSCASDMSNRRSSVTSSISGESIHYDLGTIGKNRAFMNNNQQYRQHFTGNCGSTTNTTNPAQKDIIKRRLSFFKASRRGSGFSTKSQDAAVNSIDINPADESEHDVETEDMDLDDEDDEILDDYNDTEEEENGEMDYATHDSTLTAKVELDPHHRQQERTHRQSKRVRQLYNSLLFRNRIGGCMVHTNPLFELERRLSPIQLPEILHLIFQFVIDLTPVDDYSQREIYNCLLVCKQWYLIAQKTLWREIRLRNPEKLGLFVDLLKRTESVEHLGNERNNRMRLHQKQQQNQMMSDVTIIRQHQRRASTMRYEQESIMAPMAMQKRLHERGSAVKKIVLHKLKLIEDQDIMPLTTWFHNLQILEFYICERLTDKTVVAVAENCPRLQQLLMPGCAKITDVGISQIALRCPKMKHLDLRACSNVSDESLILVARHCPELWHLNVGRVSSAPKVTGKSIVEIAKNTNLNTLGLAGCGMTDEAVIEIARHSHSGLHRCPLLTSASIRALMELCPNLAVLEIKQCVLVTDMATVYRFSTRRVLVELCPELQRRLLEYKVELSQMNDSTQEANNNNNNTMTQTSVAGQSANQHYHNNLSIQQQTTATVITHT